MNFKKYHVSRNLLNEAEPPQQIYVTATVTRYGYEVSLLSGTYTVSGGDSKTFAKTKVGTTYATAKDLSIARTLILEENGSILIYAQTADKFDFINVMLNMGSQPLPYEPYGNTWHNIPHYIHNTSTDTITTLPAVLYPNAATATVGLKGNTVQSGTPTPDNPIMPQGCGDLETVGAKAGQYKIPISSANTTTPVYLGEVHTTRKIKKLVLTGEETITFASEDDNRVVGFFTIPGMVMKSSETGYCNILQWKNSYTQSEYNRIVANGSTRFYMSIAKSALPEPTFEGFIAYLAAQYANGTPVTIWYVLATETSGIVNEPLRKIGDYADTVSGITIPTITGADSFDVLTTLKPSEVSLSYTGWHDASVKEKSANLVEDYIADCNIWTDGTLTSDTSFNMFVAKVVQGQEYSLDASLVCGFFTSKPSIGSTSYNNTRDTSGVYSFVAPIDGYIAFRKDSTETTAMLNTGSTALPYEPYWK